MGEVLLAWGGAANVGQAVVSILAVAGGAALGGFGLGFLLQFMSRFLTTRKAPPSVLRAVRIIGAVVCGILVAWWVFGPGGGGFGGGSGTGPGAGGETPTPSSAYEPPQPKEPPPETRPATEGVVRIDVLGDQRVKDGRFYRLEGETELRDLAGVKGRLEELRRGSSGPKAVELAIYENSPDKDHPAVRALTRWAREQELTVQLSFPKGPAP